MMQSPSLNFSDPLRAPPVTSAPVDRLFFCATPRGPSFSSNILCRTPFFLRLCRQSVCFTTGFPLKSRSLVFPSLDLSLYLQTSGPFLSPTAVILVQIRPLRYLVLHDSFYSPFQLLLSLPNFCNDVVVLYMDIPWLFANFFGLPAIVSRRGKTEGPPAVVDLPPPRTDP